jgi:hypothetical protein
MELRFLAKLREADATQYEQGHDFCNQLAEAADYATGRPFEPMRVEEVIVSLSAVFVQMCIDGGYDPTGVSELLIEAHSRGGKGGPDLVDA